MTTYIVAKESGSWTNGVYDPTGVTTRYLAQTEEALASETVQSLISRYSRIYRAVKATITPPPGPVTW